MGSGLEMTVFSYDPPFLPFALCIFEALKWQSLLQLQIENTILVDVSSSRRVIRNLLIAG